LTSECACQVCRSALLKEDDSDQKEAHNDVHDDDDVEKDIHFLPSNPRPIGPDRDLPSARVVELLALRPVTVTEARTQSGMKPTLEQQRLRGAKQPWRVVDAETVKGAPGRPAPGLNTDWTTVSVS
jgi:hypothetical protein